MAVLDCSKENEEFTTNHNKSNRNMKFNLNSNEAEQMVFCLQTFYIMTRIFSSSKESAS